MDYSPSNPPTQPTRGCASAIGDLSVVRDLLVMPRPSRQSLAARGEWHVYNCASSALTKRFLDEREIVSGRTDREHGTTPPIRVAPVFGENIQNESKSIAFPSLTEPARLRNE